MTKKIHLTPDEQEHLEKCVKTLPKLPICNHLHEPIVMKERWTGQHLIDEYDAVVLAVGKHNMGGIKKESIDPNGWYNLPIIQYYDTMHVMKRALKRGPGELKKEVDLWHSRHAAFLKREIELKTMAEEAKKHKDKIANLKGEELEAYKRSVADKYPPK